MTERRRMNLTPSTRKWIYGIVAATVPLLVTLGTVTNETATAVLNVLAAVLAVGGSSLAIANVPAQEVVLSDSEIEELLNK
jgi:hypothetical protein